MAEQEVHRMYDLSAKHELYSAPDSQGRKSDAEYLRDLDYAKVFLSVFGTLMLC